MAIKKDTMDQLLSEPSGTSPQNLCLCVPRLAPAGLRSGREPARAIFSATWSLIYFRQSLSQGSSAHAIRLSPSR